MADSILLCGSCHKRPTRLQCLPCGKCRRTQKSCPLLVGSKPTPADDDNGTNDYWSGYSLLAVFATSALSGCVLWGVVALPPVMMADIHLSQMMPRTILQFGAVLSCALFLSLVTRVFCSRRWNSDEEVEGRALSTIKDEDDCLSCESCLLDRTNFGSGLLSRQNVKANSKPPSYIFCQDCDDTASHQQGKMPPGARLIPVTTETDNLKTPTVDEYQLNKYKLATWKMYNRIVMARRARATCGFCMESIESGQIVTLTMGKSNTQAKRREEVRLLETSICDNDIESDREASVVKVHQACYYGATGGRACVHGNVQSAEDGMVFQLDM
jgi:hypothetical protein